MPRIAVDVIYSMWPELVLCSVVLITLRLVFLYNKKKPFILYRELLSLGFVIYIMLLFELVTTSDYYSYGSNFIPFKEIFRYQFTSSAFYQNVVGNVVIFIPFGYFVSYYCKVNRFYITVLVSFITSSTIEIIQSGVGRAFDVDDILLNVLGGFCGYLAYKLIEKIFVKFSITLKNNLLINFICVIIIFVLVLMILGLYGVF